MLTMPAAQVYLASSFVWGLLFWLMSTVFMIYQIEVVQLDALQLVLVGTALELSAFLFEVPTGVVADTWSRKFSVITGYLITGVAFLIMGFVPTFGAFLIASFIWGIGWTFISGAHQAWLADEIGESKAAGTYLKAARVSNYGALLGIIIAVVLGSIALHWPLILSGVLFLVWGALLVRLMPETGFEPDRSGASEPGIFQTFQSGVKVVRGSATLILLVLVGVVFGAFSEGYDRLSIAHLLRNFPFAEVTGFTPVIVFGLLGALGVLLSLGVVMLAERWVDTDSARQVARALSVITLLIVTCVLVFAWSGNLWVAIGMYVVMQPLRGLVEPLTMAWFNRNLPSSSRATVISMHSQADALGQIAGGPGVGLIGRECGLRLAIATAGLLLLPALWLYGRARDNTVFEPS